MSLVINCPSCRSPMRVREEYAGMQVKCPKCAGIVAVPAPSPPVEQPTAEAVIPVVLPVPARPRENGEENVTPRPPEATGRGQRCPACGERNPRSAERCRACGEWLEEEEDRQPRRKPVAYVPCPRCGARGAQRVTWTFWGSFYGPAMFTHVRCPDCGYAYNGRTGGSNMIPAILFVTFPLLGLLAICGGLFWLILGMQMR